MSGKEYAAAPLGFKDVGHQALAPLGDWLVASGWAPVLCGVSLSLSDLSVLAMLGTSLLGPSFRPMLATIMVFVLRILVALLGASEVILRLCRMLLVLVWVATPPPPLGCSPRAKPVMGNSCWLATPVPYSGVRLARLLLCADCPCHRHGNGTPSGMASID